MFPFVSPLGIVARLDLRFHGWIRSRKLSPRVAAALKRYVRIGDGWIWPVAALRVLVAGPLLFGESLAENARAAALALEECLADSRVTRATGSVRKADCVPGLASAEVVFSRRRTAT